MGITVCADHISRDRSALKSRLPLPRLPAFSCIVIHLAMSATQELIAPQGALLSTTDGEIGSGLPASGACGVATCPPEGFRRTLGLLRGLPAGPKMRSRTKSSQLIPVTAGIIWPATR